jgi:hypothetical protein
VTGAKTPNYYFFVPSCLRVEPKTTKGQIIWRGGWVGGTSAWNMNSPVAPSPSYDYAASRQVCATLSLEGEELSRFIEKRL